MAMFSISLSVEVEASSYDEAYQIQRRIFKEIALLPEVIGNPCEIDLEQTDGFEDEE